MSKFIRSGKEFAEIRESAKEGFDFLMESAALFRGLDFVKAKMEHFFKNEKRLRYYSERDYHYQYAASYPLILNEEVDFEDSLAECLQQRRNTRSFSSSGPIALSQLSVLLKLSAGLNKDGSNHRRFYPSGGALYTLRTYIYASNVDGLPRGVYLFNPIRDTLDLVNSAITDSNISDCISKSESVEKINEFGFIIFVSSRPKISTIKYGNHGIKVVLMEVGHLMQNFCLMLPALGLKGYINSAIDLQACNFVFRTESRYEIFFNTLIIGK